MSRLKNLANAAKTAARSMANATLDQKNEVLKVLTVNLQRRKEDILEANRRDIIHAKANGLSAPLLERLSLENRFEGIIHDIAQVIALRDPVGELFDEERLPNQLQVAKYRTPIGVLGVIYESRPNVTIDISILAIKSGNSSILRGGTEALHTNQILVEMIQLALVEVGLPKDAVQLIFNSDRSEVKELLQLYEYIDLIIPRGGSALQQFCREHSKIPVITGGVGVCHLFVDESADLERSLIVILNAKTQRPTVCNALDTVLIHAAIASKFIPEMMEKLGKEGVMFRMDEWGTEWLSLVLGIKVVEDLREAIQHIQHHGSGHSDGILTESSQNAEIFVREIDSGVVYVNASTRFTDGGQLGLGAEVAISTQKLHARGPMGLKELTSYKWIVRGDYQIRR